MLEWSKTALVFPGQGSQVIGMGKDLLDTFPIVRETFQTADEILGFSLSTLCFEGPEAELNLTLNTQPALYVTSIALLRAFRETVADAQPYCVAGHSLGEITALSAAGAVSFEDGLRLVRERGRLMTEAGETSPGAMAAVMALDASVIRQVCADASAHTGGVVVLANDNGPTQRVISGDVATLDYAIEQLQAAGARRIVKLAVSIAAHSPLMEPAAVGFRTALANTSFVNAQTTVFANVSASPIQTAQQIREELDLQLTNSVRWTESVQEMVKAGVNTFIEIGPKNVLSGLIGRIDASVRTYAVNNLDSLHGINSL